MKRTLPAHLAKQYGSDPDQVRAKLQFLTQNFDWEEFNPEECTMNSIPVSERLSYYNNNYNNNDNIGVGIAYNSGNGGIDNGNGNGNSNINDTGNDNDNDNDDSNSSGGLRDSVRSPPP